VNRIKSRRRLRDKIVPLIQHFDTIVGSVRDKLLSRNFNPGADMIVMTLNDGELDLFINYACSCYQHNISLTNTIVFSASAEAVHLIESTGAMAVHHEGFSSVSREASLDYIDFTFVDMMWYKSLSLYVMIHLQYNVLFQDVDWVMFKDHFEVIRQKIAEYKAVEGEDAELDLLFSDDGNLSLRYAPFFANSGFYYIRASRRTLQLSWSIIESMDYITRLGSHQNVLTMRLMELTDLVALRSKLIPLRLLPNGILYHHDKEFMTEMFERRIKPYGFHMCWTKGKPEKLVWVFYFSLVILLYFIDTVLQCRFISRSLICGMQALHVRVKI
jgi:Nucleotide-diphospho-sugar transferase